MNRISVTSSNIKSIGYSPQEKLLEVEFTNGSVYDYPEVEQSLYDAFIGASSHGSFFHENIKYNYSFRRIS